MSNRTVVTVVVATLLGLRTRKPAGASETTRVIGAARATVGVTVSESDSDSSDATIVEITGTVIVKSIVLLFGERRRL